MESEVAPTKAIMEVVLDVPLQPEGNIHWYEIAPDTAEVEYVWLVPKIATSGPVMEVGWPGAPISVSTNGAPLPPL